MVRKVSVCFLRSQKGISPSLLNNIVIYNIYPAHTNLFWLPCCGLRLEVHLIRNIMMLFFSGTKLSHYINAFGSQCDSLPRSFPTQPGVVSAASARHLFLLSSFPALSCVRQQLRSQWLGALPSCVISFGCLLTFSFQVSL